MNKHELLITEDGRSIYSLGEGGTNKFWLRIDYAGREKVTPEEAKQVAADLVKSYNMHDELVEALYNANKLLELKYRNTDEIVGPFMMDNDALLSRAQE